MLLDIVLVGQLATAPEHGHCLVYQPPALPAGQVDGIEVHLQGIAGSDIAGDPV
ncbi:hypothetical protein NDY24_18160 [Xanthomonas hortorum pv. pelargonii]|nr:hypothetical protein NDY24_18160 [Xanthomonas hortorum pv. pelargonii]